jgi:predicted glutamine amidotransferase
MCRFVAYLGTPLKLEDLLYHPTNSLINQSYKAKERPEPLNGDGFGIGWYENSLDPEPCVQTYVTPAWSNRNLFRLSRKVAAPCIFAHVRAASPNMFVMEANVHPFKYQNLLFMHNGSVGQFEKIKRPLRAALKDEFYGFIQGTTDSEHAFALFLNNLENPVKKTSVNEIRNAVVKTIRQLDEWTRAADIKEPSYYNFAVTNGAEMVVSRYSSVPENINASLHYSRGKHFSLLPNGEYDMRNIAENEPAAAVIVSSEILTNDASDFPDVPNNHTITVNKDLTVKLEEIK